MALGDVHKMSEIQYLLLVRVLRGLHLEKYLGDEF